MSWTAQTHDVIPESQGDYHIAAELGDVIVGRHSGCRSSRELTVPKSVGLRVEDVAAALYTYHEAEASAVGLTVDFGGRNHAQFMSGNA